MFIPPALLSVQAISEKLEDFMAKVRVSQKQKDKLKASDYCRSNSSDLTVNPNSQDDLEYDEEDGTITFDKRTTEGKEIDRILKSRNRSKKQEESDEDSEDSTDYMEENESETDADNTDYDPDNAVGYYFDDDDDENYYDSDDDDEDYYDSDDDDDEPYESSDPDQFYRDYYGEDYDEDDMGVAD